MKRKIIGAMAALSIGAALFAGEKTVDFARVNDPSTRSTYSVILNSNFANEALLKLPLECAFVCNFVCNFSNKKPFPSAKRGNGKIFQFFFEQGGEYFT